MLWWAAPLAAAAQPVVREPTCVNRWLITWLNRSITMGLGASLWRATGDVNPSDTESRPPRGSRDCARRAASGRADDGVQSGLRPAPREGGHARAAAAAPPPQ